MHEHESQKWALTAIAVLAASLAGCGDDETTNGTGTGTAPEAEVTILFTSDEHSHLVGFAPELDDYPTPTSAGDGSIRGGMARRMALVEQLRQEAAARGAASILVSSGDTVMGALPHITYETASADWAMMTAVGYDVMGMGNHELDFGPAVLASALSAAKAAGTLPPMLAANIRFSDSDSGDDALAAHYSETPADGAALHPYHVIETDNGIRVGFIGLLGADAAQVAPNKTPVLFSGEAEEEADADVVLPKLYADLQPWVDHLRQVEGVDLVVALSHAGLGVAEEDHQICQNVSGLDLILSGHSHNTDGAPTEFDNPSGNKCLVLNGGAYGALLGRIDLTVSPGSGGPASWNAETQALTPIDDSIVPDADTAAVLDETIAAIEAADEDGSGDSYLERLVSYAEETAVSDDAGTPGDLYFHVLASTDFDVTDARMLNFLSADAMLAASDELGIHTDMALESAGVVRADILQGKTGNISVADAFAVVPLGSSPSNPSSIGYPLTRAYIRMVELILVFEFSLERGPTNSDYNLGQAGVKLEYDLTQPNGSRVQRIWKDSDHSDGFEQYDTLLFDRAASFTSPDRVSIVTSSYVFQFAGSAGVTPKDENGDTITLDQALMLRPDNSEVKQIEAFLHFLRWSPGGTLPVLYDETSPSATDRMTCLAGC